MSSRSPDGPLPGDTSPIVIDVPADIADLVPPYLERRLRDHCAFTMAIRARRWREIKQTAHRIKGNAGSFGFTRLSEIGGHIEAAAQREDVNSIGDLVDEMGRYLARVKVRTITGPGD